MKLKYYYKINKQGNPILGSNISRMSKPVVGKWQEIKNACCEKEFKNCSCTFKYYVKIDSQGNPINYSLIKRTKRPESDGERFLRVPDKICCIVPMQTFLLSVEPCMYPSQLSVSVRIVNNDTLVENVFVATRTNILGLPYEITVELPIGNYSYTLN